MSASDKPRSSISDDNAKLKDVSHDNKQESTTANFKNTESGNAVNMAEQETDQSELIHIDPSPIDEPATGSSASTHNANTERLQELSLSSKKPDTLSVETQVDAPPPPPLKDDAYIDPTPKTPQAPRSPLGLPSEYTEKELPSVPQDEQLEDRKEDGEVNDDDQSEIQSIMEQFSDETKGPNETEIMSPRLELAEHFMGQQSQFPQRKSSLEPLPQSASNFPTSSGPSSIPSPIIVPKSAPNAGTDIPDTPQSTSSRTGLPPPEPEPDQPFDFHRFLEQLRHRTADPVAKFLRSFLTEFGKKQWLVHEQVKIISDFLAFITNKMAQCEVWKHVSDAEFDNAKEGMEKLVMNRLYSQTFSPAIPPPPSVIFGLLKHSKNPDTSADSFVPILIYVVLKANPEHLVSNVQYILRFRNQDKLGGEAGYYLSSLSGAIQFIETLDRTSLTVSDEEFEKNVEAAVSAIAQENMKAESETSSAQATPRASADTERLAQRRDAGSTTINEDENAPVAGLLRSIQKPLSSIGRIFSEDSEPDRRLQQSSANAPPLPERGPAAGYPSSERIDAQEAAARQASAEAAEARRIQRVEHRDVVETLSGMFPNLDKDIIDDVVRMKEGRVGLAVDACLALSSTE
ncbi:hypothetical protein TCE0_042f14605 [Talaromyces pinophilus]|uniref:Guanine nucleotide exchange factor Vps9 n=1 Tax=Talaromyces pinophilus TaxID=128442 RepID=A0A6V8HKM1_TALPI|nr:hypothetical protein TCE0_042f14605 [Talaromyces pinophilus]